MSVSWTAFVRKCLPVFLDLDSSYYNHMGTILKNKNVLTCMYNPPQLILCLATSSNSKNRWTFGSTFTVSILHLQVTLLIKSLCPSLNGQHWLLHFSLLSHVWLFLTPRTVDPQAPLSMGFSRQEYWSGLSFPSSGHLSDPGIQTTSPALKVGSLPLSDRELIFFHYTLKH